jgi:predicted RNase H-like HicB family nuclease
MSYQVSVVIERDEHGFFAYCPQLEGCHSQGETLDEVMQNIQEAVSLYLETLSEAETRQLLSRAFLATSIEVKVA